VEKSAQWFLVAEKQQQGMQWKNKANRATSGKKITNKVYSRQNCENGFLGTEKYQGLFPVFGKVKNGLAVASIAEKGF